MSTRGFKTSLQRIEAYYSEKLASNGPTHLGVDWNSAESQNLRFQQLCKIIDLSAPFSLNDIGCGYGALAAYLESVKAKCDYRGFDISQAMIEEAARVQGGKAGRRFTSDLSSVEPADYAIASGIFNVRLEIADDAWKDHMHETLDRLHSLSLAGFSFNALTSYSDRERQRDYLYYADPTYWFDVCKRRYSKNVALLHDYGLYEFTILVRK